MSGLRFNEGKSCDAVIRVLEARAGLTRYDLVSPEREGHQAPVEFSFKLGEQLFALEHTGVEPFAGHMRLNAEAPANFDPIKAALLGRLPAGDFFELHVPAGAMQALPRGSRRSVQAALAAWIERAAPTLPRTEMWRYAKPIRRETPAGVPFEVSLHRHSRLPNYPIEFSVKHIVTAASQEDERRARIRAACAKKFPKLAWWKLNAGARTVLVLEDNDIQLSNPQVIYDALTAVETEFADRPDEVHVVSTFIDPTWWLHQLRVGGVGYYELSERHACMTEFDPAVLEDLTASFGLPRESK